MEEQGFVDCRHGTFPFESNDCPGCQNERAMHQASEAIARERRRKDLSGLFYENAKQVIERRMKAEMTPIIAERDALLTAVYKHEREVPVPPRGLIDQLLNGKRYRELAINHDRVRKQLARSIDANNTKLTSCQARWAPKRVAKEIGRAVEAQRGNNAEFKTLEAERELAEQKREARRDLCRAEFKKLRPDDDRTLRFPEGFSETGTLVAASQIEGRLYGFLDCKWAVFCIRLSLKAYLKKIALPARYEPSSMGGNPTVITDDSDDEL